MRRYRVSGKIYASNTGFVVDLILFESENI